MTAPTFGERLRVARLATLRHRRRFGSALMRTLLLAPRASPPLADELRFVPADLVTPDPSFLDELLAGEMGLAGVVVGIGRHSPFAVASPSLAWARAAHGFGWLRHLRAVGDATAADAARRFTADWIARSHADIRRSVAFEGEVMAERVVAWLQSAHFLLDGCSPEFYRDLTHSLGQQVRLLDIAQAGAPPGLAGLRCLIASMLANLALAGHDAHRARIERAFLARLDADILAEGCHVGRNPDVVLDLLLDLLPLRQCYLTLALQPPRRLVAAIERMVRHLRRMRRGDGELARFNGMGATRIDALATVLAYDSGAEAIEPHPAAGYQRLQQGAMIVIVDAAGPPPLELSGTAHAGCLAFEMTWGETVILSNGGAAVSGSSRERCAEARATTSHNVLTIEGRSSSRLVTGREVERLLGAPGLAGPPRVTRKGVEGDAAATIEASHDGFVNPYGLVHRRRLTLAADGSALAGVDTLSGASGALRTRRDLPFAIHFHLADGAVCEPETFDTGVAFVAPDGTRWKLTVTGGRTAVAESRDFTQLGQDSGRWQIVVRGVTAGETEVGWSLERVPSG